MQKIISLFTALMIFSFSLLGEAVHADSSTCADSGITQPAVKAAACKSPKTSSTLEVVQKVSPVEQDTHMHDCHFGHCAFTLLLPAKIGSPISFISNNFLQPHPPIQSGYRSETIRPPAII